jgi:hypothetical protein
MEKRTRSIRQQSKYRASRSPIINREWTQMVRKFLLNHFTI